jgi:hypothetical protein
MTAIEAKDERYTMRFIITPYSFNTVIIKTNRSMNVAFDKLEKLIPKNQNSNKKMGKKVTLP